MKRLFDIIAAATGLLLAAPLLAALWVLVRIKLGAPALFRQDRPGRHGRKFVMYKFRTMTDARDADGNLLSDGERMHPLGKWLRKTSLDELPELWNVLRGDMSLVGPRPLLMEYLPLYTERQRRRHEVCPGITGWAQVNGRNALTWEKKFELDVWYVDHQSMALDLKILVRTVLQTLRSEGINATGHATMPKFQGSKNGNE